MRSCVPLRPVVRSSAYTEQKRYLRRNHYSLLAALRREAKSCTNEAEPWLRPARNRSTCLMRRHATDLPAWRFFCGDRAKTKRGAPEIVRCRRKQRSSSGAAISVDESPARLSGAPNGVLQRLPAPFQICLSSLPYEEPTLFSVCEVGGIGGSRMRSTADKARRRRKELRRK